VITSIDGCDLRASVISVYACTFILAALRHALSLWVGSISRDHNAAWRYIFQTTIRPREKCLTSHTGGDQPTYEHLDCGQNPSSTGTSSSRKVNVANNPSSSGLGFQVRIYYLDVHTHLFTFRKQMT